MNAVDLSLTQTMLEAAAEQMGATLQRAAFSANIKERRDFSCALFDVEGRLLAQAAHIPVHLGSMPESVAAVLAALPDLPAGQSAIVNDPYHGGSHLPDVTLVTPVDLDGRRLGYAASRAHFADIGGTFPGGMGLSTHIDEEGVRLPPMPLEQGAAQLIAAARKPDEVRGDLAAQAAANRVGAEALRRLARQPTYAEAAAALHEHGERFMRETLRTIPNGTYETADVLDDDGAGTIDIPLRCVVTVADAITIDLTASADAVPGCVNCPAAVTRSAVYYVFACLMHAQFEDAPLNAGSFSPLQVLTRPGSVLHAAYPSAVCAGNTETSMRVVDLVFAVLRKALPDRVPAASSGSMNSVAFGGNGWSYYETIPGGAGASPTCAGAAAVHTHMTNTRNTPAEAMELQYPLRVTRYEVAEATGGAGDLPGGDGVVRELEALADCEATLLTERRRHGAGNGTPGQNLLNGSVLGGKAAVTLRPGDRLTIRTPGGSAL